MKRYNPTEIEPKWQKIWAESHRYHVTEQSDKQKYYISCMFPYPSGAGMHTGHAFEHAIVDSTARFYRQLGYNVLNPMGWDAFGLPAENYAIKTGTAPAIVTKQNIANFKNQLIRMGASLDWDREINTSDPEYYKWTQWIFTELFTRGLAYQKESMQWWCPVDKTVLANEQVVNGKCWRCEQSVEKKSMKQWFFKITDYADSLLEELPALNWPKKIKTAQENWIGKSVGAEIQFQISNKQLANDNEQSNRQLKTANLLPTANCESLITVFTTRPDTLFGATFLVLAPEHPLARQLVNDNTRLAVNAYIDEALKKSEIERMAEGKEKTGVFTGSYAINPATGENIPIWIADYVLGGYGTGAIMAVPAHDERDYEFAKKFDLPIVQVVMPSAVDTTNPPQPQFEEVVRDTVIVHLRDASTGKYAVLDWHGTLEGTTTAIMGGIEPGQTVEEAARMEIMEEAGLNTVNILKTIPWVTSATYCASHKSENRKAIARVALAEVENLDGQAGVTEYEETTHTLRWVNREEMLATLTPDHQKLVWQLLENEEIVRSEGELMNSGQFDGMPTSEAREQIVAWLEQQGVGKLAVTYKMRDWLVSRQRYWGAPIPIIHCATHGAVAVPEDQLPVVLPAVEDFAPKGDGKSVLARETEWVNTTCPTCGEPALRETDTMDGYACSSWYLLRYTDPHNNEQAWDPTKANYWAPLDMYVGGDHAVAHLLYVRFWNHVFYDMGLVAAKEPVKRLVYHGLIGAEDGRKMSKSLGNVVDPLDIIDQGYGADALRVFCLFLGPINENSNWSSTGIAGIYRFLNRVWVLVQEYLVQSTQTSDTDKKNAALLRATHFAIKKVTEDYQRLSFNTGIAALMEYVNELYKLKLQGMQGSDWREAIEALVRMIAPMAPHLGAELWRQLGYTMPLEAADWPAWNESHLVAGTVTIIVQVNGKLRAKLEVDVATSEEAIKNLALTDENVQKFLTGQPKKVIYIKGKLVSIVT
ncbi:MAG: class I tRNA ligase family protein [Candidatus Saccharimonas sp.]